MNVKQWSLIILLGVACFVIGAMLLAFGYLEMPWTSLLTVMGLILIGVGASGKRRAS